MVKRVHRCGGRAFYLAWVEKRDSASCFANTKVNIAKKQDDSALKVENYRTNCLQINLLGVFLSTYFPVRTYLFSTTKRCRFP